MRCNHALDLVSRRIDNELTFEDREALLDHLKGCESCRNHSRACEEDAFRIRRVLRFFRPKKAEFIQRTIALITEHEEPHREIALTEEPTSRSASWKHIAAFTVPAAAAVIAFCAYLQFSPSRSAEIERLQATVADNERKIGNLQDRVRRNSTEFSEPISPKEAAGNTDVAKAPVVVPSASNASDKPIDLSDDSTQGNPNPTNPTTTAASGEKLDRVQAQMQTLMDALDNNDLAKAMSIAMEIGNAVIEVNSVTGQLASRLTDILDRPNLESEDRIALMSMLAKIHTDVTASYFREELEKPDTQMNVTLRRALADGLAQNADDSPATRQLLSAMLSDSQEDYLVRTAAARGLIQLAASASASDDVFNTIKALVIGPTPVDDPRMRLEIIQILSRAPTPGLVEFLNSIALTSPEQDERAAAIDSLGELTGSSARDALNDLLNNPHVPADLKSRARRSSDRSRTPPRSSNREDERHR